MELTAAEHGLLREYLSSFSGLTGDRRTRTVFHEVVRGVVGAESLSYARIAACPLGAGGPTTPAVPVGPAPRPVRRRHSDEAHLSPGAGHTSA